MVRIFPHSDLLRRDTKYTDRYGVYGVLFNFLNAGKCGPEKLQIRTLFTQLCSR